MQDMLGYLSTYGYIILFLYSLGGGMVAIIAAGVLSYSGNLNLGLCILIAGVANAIGDTILFYLSRYNKSQFMPYFKKQRRNLALAQILFKKHGDWIILIKKYIYGAKTLVPIAIGLTKYSFKKFTIINVISSFIWSITLGLLSYFAGDLIKRVYQVVVDKPYIMPIILLIIVACIYLYFKKFTKKPSVKQI